MAALIVLMLRKGEGDGTNCTYVKGGEGGGTNCTYVKGGGGWRH